MMHGSLFSGLGGFDLAAEWMGWRNVFNCERDPFCRQVLRHHFPNAQQHEDITKFNAKKYRHTIDVLTGGFPCQPFSNAGQRKGMDDPRWLWDDMFRIVAEIAPRWVIAENVRGLITQSHGIPFNTVCNDLENEGYAVTAYVLPAASVNAPHKRERVFIVANTNGSRTGQETGRTATKAEKIRGHKEGNISEPFGICGNASDTNGSGRVQNQRKRKRTEFVDENGQASGWETFPSFSPICGGNDGVSHGLDGITFPKWRRESIKAYGNAIVPQIAHVLFQTIETAEHALR